jgi:hypothetical protein
MGCGAKRLLFSMQKRILQIIKFVPSQTESKKYLSGFKNIILSKYPYFRNCIHYTVFRTEITDVIASSE